MLQFLRAGVLVRAVFPSTKQSEQCVSLRSKWAATYMQKRAGEGRADYPEERLLRKLDGCIEEELVA